MSRQKHVKLKRGREREREMMKKENQCLFSLEATVALEHRGRIFGCGNDNESRALDTAKFSE